MDPVTWWDVVKFLAPALVACGGAYLGVRVAVAEINIHLGYLRRDLDEHHRRITALEGMP